VGQQVVANGLGRLLGAFAAELQKGKNVDGDIALELRSGLLETDGLGIEVVAEEVLEGALQRRNELGTESVLEHGLGLQRNGIGVVG
jgi:hypothetical protein